MTATVWNCRHDDGPAPVAQGSVPLSRIPRTVGGMPWWKCRPRAQKRASRPGANLRRRVPPFLASISRPPLPVGQNGVKDVMYPDAGFHGPQAGENKPEESPSSHLSCYSKEGSRASQWYAKWPPGGRTCDATALHRTIFAQETALLLASRVAGQRGQLGGGVAECRIIRRRRDPGAWRESWAVAVACAGHGVRPVAARRQRPAV